MGEERLRIRFSNLETPGAREDFTYEGTRYYLEDGKEYKLPIDVIEHLNGLQIPDPQYEEDPETGQIVHKRDRVKHRFNCQILDLRNLARRLAEKESKEDRGKPPKPTFQAAEETEEVSTA